MWGSDTGGYFAPPSADNELLARWLEFSAFSPMMEVILGPKRTLWDDYSPEVVGIAQKYVAAHHDLIPYTRSAMYQATQDGMPIMRALVLAYPDDARLTDMWDEYLYGDSLLVAPVTTAQTTEREVYLPAGKWMNYHDKQTVYAGRQHGQGRRALGDYPRVRSRGSNHSARRHRKAEQQLGRELDSEAAPAILSLGSGQEPV